MDWEIKMKCKSNGITLIETVLGMAMLTVIGMMAVPQFVVAADEASAQARWDISVMAKNSSDTITTQTGEIPTVMALAESLPAVNGKAVAGGILVRVDGGNHIIPTYANALCNEPTSKVDDKVRCVGSISQRIFQMNY
jgi:type II secretory pathway pseudopilin PulG